MTAPFAIEFMLVSHLANARMASILADFREADAETLPMLPTMLDSIGVGGPMTELVQALELQPGAGEWMPTSHIVMMARDIKDAAAARERDMDTREVSGADHNAAFMRWEAAYELYHAVIDAPDAPAKRGT